MNGLKCQLTYWKSSYKLHRICHSCEVLGVSWCAVLKNLSHTPNQRGIYEFSRKITMWWQTLTFVSQSHHHYLLYKGNTTERLSWTLQNTSLPIDSVKSITSIINPMWFMVLWGCTDRNQVLHLNFNKSTIKLWFSPYSTEELFVQVAYGFGIWDFVNHYIFVAY